MIIANQHIKTALSVSSVQELDKVIRPLLERREKVVVDFTGITIFSSLFFNSLIQAYMSELGEDEYAKLFEFINLNHVGESTYKHCLAQVKLYMRLTPEEREQYRNVLSEVIADLS